MAANLPVPQKKTYLGTNLKAAGVTINYEPWMIDEITKCMDDPIYFVKTYVKIVTLDNGLQPFLLYPFQEDLIKLFHENRFVCAKTGRQNGKCCSENTTVKIRNKTSGEIVELTMGELYAWQKFRQSVKTNASTF
jgi:hypothetical protein